MRIWKRMILTATAAIMATACCACAKNPTLSSDLFPDPSTETATEPAPEQTTEPTPAATAPAETTTPTEPDTVSVLDFLRIAAQPVGSTMYIWGGGWNEEDTGAGIEAITLGISPSWAAFAANQDSSYDYQNHKYQIHDGLDCSGYVGWAVYNALETENGRNGYVCASTKMARSFADRGLGDYISAEDMTEWLPGDIMSMKGHVWICVGMCDDGSVLLLHASPPGVIFSGTVLCDGSDSQAVALAEKIMQEHYPDWYSRYPDCSRSNSYLDKSSAMRWSTDVLSDDEGLREMDAQEVVDAIFGTA